MASFVADSDFAVLIGKPLALSARQLIPPVPAFHCVLWTPLSLLLLVENLQ